MANNTKEKILEVSLNLFSENGYAGTNIQSIADSVGIVKSALYRHFESKEEIWLAVFEMMISYYEEHFGSAERLANIPQNTDELYAMTMRMVNFTVHDEKVIKMRKIIMTEQFRDEKVRKLATRYFIEDTRTIFEKVFETMENCGAIQRYSPRFLATVYTAPITAFIHLCDREPEKREETVAEIGNFIKQFIEIYGVTV